MGTRWDVQSHEDRYSSGIPDLSYGARGVNGWIELKHIKCWKGKTPVKPDKYTSIQVNWINKRDKKAGHCFVAVKVADDYFLLLAEEAKKIKTGMTKDQYKSSCVKHWHKSVLADELLSLITSGRP